mgnify:CR=1 FL=1
MNHRLFAALAVFAVLAVSSVLAEENAEPASLGAETVPLIEVLDSVRRETGRTFVMDTRVGPQLVIGQLVAGDVDYHRLLVILRNNGLAAVKVGDVTTIVPVDIVRQFPLPVVHEDAGTIDDEEWITLVISVKKAEATQLVPIFRPLLPREGHMAAHPGSNILTIVDRAGNARRVAELISTLDRETKSR